MSTELTVDLEGQGERIDRFLVRHLTGQSRSQLQKLIASGRLRLNGTTTNAHHIVKTGDRIVVDDDMPIAEQPSRRDMPVPTVLYEDDQLLVIDKPVGLIVHPAEGVRGPTLVDWLRDHVPEINQVGDDPKQRPGIVHRLDKDVSGVMVIAKTQQAFEHLKRQFQDRTVEKEYLALVHGIPERSEGTIDAPIARSRRQSGRMAAVADDAGGREAVTHYVIERKVKMDALLRVRIETGRTHQIRVHLKSIGHPIVGDTVYTTKPYKRKPAKLDRPFLHAARLAFTDLNGQRREFTSPLPNQLQRYLHG